MMSEIDYQAIFNAASQPYAILSPEYKILGVNKAYLMASNQKIERLIGNNVFDVFPENPDDTLASGVKNITASLKQVLDTKKPHAMAIQRYDLQMPNGDYEIRFWKTENIPILDKCNDITCILTTVTDVTHDQIQNDELIKATINQEKLVDANRRITDLLEINLKFEQKNKY